jgi:hypothetical protein
MKIRNVKNNEIIPGRIVFRHNNRHSIQTNERHQQKAHGEKMEICVCEGCSLGPIEIKPILASMRFTTGYLKYRKFGPFFEESLRFFDGRKHKFAHSLCAYEHGIIIDELKMDKCMLCPKKHDREPRPYQFYCEREPEECCLLVEQGYFQSRKGGLFAKFVAEKQAVVHWACAREEWRQALLTEEFDEDLHYVSPK